MNLKEAESGIGQRVVYLGGHRPDNGVIIEVRAAYVMVRYTGDTVAKATHPRGLGVSEMRTAR